MQTHCLGNTSQREAFTTQSVKYIPYQITRIKSMLLKKKTKNNSLAIDEIPGNIDKCSLCDRLLIQSMLKSENAKTSDAPLLSLDEILSFFTCSNK